MYSANLLDRANASLIRVRRTGYRFFSDVGGATAVEFGLVAVPFISMLLFIMMVGLILYMNQALDYATSKAARQVMVGNVQTQNLSKSAFQSSVCSNLPAAMTCTNVIVNLQTTTEATKPGGYYAYVNSSVSGLTLPALTNATAAYSVGTSGSYEYLQVLYPVTFIPSLLAALLSSGATYNGAAAFVLVSTVAFKNEQY